jgi:hypothetical protein
LGEDTILGEEAIWAKDGILFTLLFLLSNNPSTRLLAHIQEGGCHAGPEVLPGQAELVAPSHDDGV